MHRPLSTFFYKMYVYSACDIGTEGQDIKQAEEEFSNRDLHGEI